LKKDTIEHARIVAELESKLVAVTDRATALATERRRLAFSSATGSDAKAASKLEKLNADSAVVLIENENLHAALEEARHRLASAEHIADQARRKTDAERLRGQVKELADKIQARGPAMAAALVTFCEAYAALEADLQSLRDLGAEIAPSRNVRLAFEAVLSHTLRGAGLRVGNLVEPGRRHTPAELTTGYASRAREWADGALNDKAAA
jgi:hypothetical protein